MYMYMSYLKISLMKHWLGITSQSVIKGTGKECRRVECKSAKLGGEMIKELSDGITETEILQNP